MIKVYEDHVTVNPAPKRPKKITGTRFASILGLDPWKTPFKTWCDMTNVYKEPFEDTVYTLAGKIIEPKVIAYLNKRYCWGKLKSAEQFYGTDSAGMRYDHFHEEPIFGGMWDARTPNTVYELKASKRVDDWYKNGEFDAPIYYKLQGALYAHLMGIDEFVMVLSITDDAILADPESFEPSPENTLFRKYTLSGDFPQFKDLINVALDWHGEHIKKGISPPYETKDSDIIKALTTKVIAPSGEDVIGTLMQIIEPLKTDLDKAQAKVDEIESQLKPMVDELKVQLISKMGEDDKKVTLAGKLYKVEVIKKQSTTIDKARLATDGILEKYQTVSESTSISIKKIKGE